MCFLLDIGCLIMAGRAHNSRVSSIVAQPADCILLVWNAADWAKGSCLTAV